MITEEPDGTFHVDFATGTRLDLDELRARKKLKTSNGVHAWVIQAVFAIDDPTMAMDNMELGANNFVGVTDIHCMVCNESFREHLRYLKCPAQRLANSCN